MRGVWKPLWNHWKLHWLLTAIGLIRTVPAVRNVVTSLCMVVAGPIGTPQLRALWVIWKIKSSSGRRSACKSAWQLCSSQLSKCEELGEWEGKETMISHKRRNNSGKPPRNSSCSCGITPVCIAVSLTCRHNNSIAAWTSAWLIHQGICNQPLITRSILWLILSVSKPPNLNKLIKMPQEPDIKKGKPSWKRLTAVSFIWTIWTVCAMVTPVFFWDAAPVVTGELAAGARPSSWGRSRK